MCIVLYRIVVVCNIQLHQSQIHYSYYASFISIISLVYNQSTTNAIAKHM